MLLKSVLIMHGHAQKIWRLLHSKTSIISCFLNAGLEKLVLSYIHAISSGDLPCMEDAVLALAKIENLAAMQKAIAHYDQQMSQKLQLPTENLQELLDLHRASEKEAIKIFMENSFKDANQVFLTELVVIVLSGLPGYRIGSQNSMKK